MSRLDEAQKALNPFRYIRLPGGDALRWPRRRRARRSRRSVRCWMTAQTPARLTKGRPKTLATRHNRKIIFLALEQG